MTVIVVKKYKDRIEIACDEQVTSNIKSNVKDYNYNKIKKINKDMIFGGAGMLDTCASFIEFAKSNLPETNNLKGMYRYIQSFYEFRNKLGRGVAEMHSILIYKNKIYEIIDNHSIVEIKKSCAVGSGNLIAKAALKLGQTPKKAATIAAELDPFCGGSIVSIVKKLKGKNKWKIYIMLLV